MTNQEPLGSVLPYACPECRTTLSVGTERSQFVCGECGAVYPVKDGIPILSKENGYWSNVPRETMWEVIEDAESTGDWRGAVQRGIPHCEPAIAPLWRADAQFVLPIGSDSRVLDAGSMWGGLSVALGQFAGEVHSLDKTWESLRLLDVRARQEGLTNIIPVVGTLRQIPFPDESFDAVVLNGVLEWTAMDEEVVVDDHWRGRWTSAKSYAESPRAAQLRVLREVRRVIRPGGFLYVAIENRWGLQYVLGHPDDHVNVRFVPFLPRALANAVVRTLKGVAYRTHIYSPPALRALLEEAGFPSVDLLSAHPHYGKMWRLTPFQVFEDVREIATTAGGHRKSVAFSFAWKRTPSAVTRWVSPSIAAVAGAGTTPNPPRVLRSLVKVGALTEEEANGCRLVLANSRFEDHNPVIVLVQDVRRAETRLVCKIARRRADRHLDHEVEILRELQRRLGDEDVSASVPTLTFAGDLDGFQGFVTNALPGQPMRGDAVDALRRLGRAIDLGAGLGRAVGPLQAVASQLWRRRMEGAFRRSLRMLADLQRCSRDGELTISQFVHVVDGWLVRCAHHVEEKDARQVLDRLSKQPGVVPLGLQHGDFDVVNILVSGSKVSVVDFEHASFGAPPTFDIGNLLFTPLVMEWKEQGRREPLVAFADRSGWTSYISGLVEAYAQASGLSVAVLHELPTLTALEQNAKTYPDHRDPSSYPLRDDDVCRQMTGWSLRLQEA